jgi:hypothetical protein
MNLIADYLEQGAMTVRMQDYDTRAQPGLAPEFGFIVS